MREQKEITLELAPPRRLFDSLRFRSFKLEQDRHVYGVMRGRIDELAADGWVLERLTVDWGQRIPGLREQRDEFVRRLFGNVPIDEIISGQGKGRTIIHLSRECP